MAEKVTQVNKGIKKDVATELFKEIVVCNKCDKEVEFTLESQLFLNCPRCGKKLQRNLKKEVKEGKQIIKEDIKRRGKGEILAFTTFLTVVGLTYLIVALFTGLIAKTWLFSLIPLPLFFIALISNIVTSKSISVKIRFFSKIMLIVNAVMIAVAILAIFPEVRDIVGLK